jgi:hypothetical protein
MLATHPSPIPLALALISPNFLPHAGRDGFPRGGQHAPVEHRHRWACTSVPSLDRTRVDEWRSCGGWMG